MKHHLEASPRGAAFRGIRSTRIRSTLGLALLSLFAALAALRAGAGETAFGGTGGDSIGSLPQSLSSASASFGGTESTAGPERPAFSLVGVPSDIQGVILDAFATGDDASYAIFPLGDEVFRVEFYGRVTVLLDHQRLMELPVASEVRIGQTFHGAMATISVGGELRLKQVLFAGSVRLPLQQLSGAGTLLQGVLWHAVNRDHEHRVIDVKRVGNVVRVEQRD